VRMPMLQQEVSTDCIIADLVNSQGIKLDCVSSTLPRCFSSRNM